jgi:hypothetical protein
MKTCVTLILAFFLCVVSTYGQKIIVNGGNWVVTAPTLTEAGTNYASSFTESASNQTIINATARSILGLLPTFKVYVHKINSGISWPSSLTLSARRTSGGNGLALLAALSGGISYQTITSSPTLFFQYGGVLSLTNINDIHIQYRIDGISVLTPVGTYSTTVYFTITE